MFELMIRFRVSFMVRVEHMVRRRVSGLELALR